MEFKIWNDTTPKNFLTSLCLRLFGYAIIWSAVVDTWLKWRHDDDNSQQTLVWEWKISGVIPVVS